MDSEKKLQGQLPTTTTFSKKTKQAKKTKEDKEQRRRGLHTTRFCAVSESYTAETFFFLLWLTGRADCLHVQGSNETSNACGESHKWDTTAAQRNQGWVLLVQPFANHRKGKEWVPKRQKKKTKWKKHTTRTSNGTCCNPQPNPTESVQNVTVADRTFGQSVNVSFFCLIQKVC